MSVKLKPNKVNSEKIVTDQTYQESLLQLEKEDDQVRFKQTELYNSIQTIETADHSEVLDITVEEILDTPQKLKQTIEHIESTPKKLELVDQLISNLLSAEVEHELQDTERTTYKNIETAPQLEYIDILLTNLEEDFQRVESEYIGKLLVSKLANIVEIDRVDEYEVDRNIQFPQLKKYEIESNLSRNSEINNINTIEKELDIYLESIDPEQADKIIKVVNELRIILKENQNFLEESSVEIKEIVDHRVEELCRQLFENLDIAYDDKIIKEFIFMIKMRESLYKLNIESNDLSIDRLNYLGTLEYKSFWGTLSLGSFAKLIKRKIQPNLILGRYAIQVSQPIK